jgi:hypothetical protein
LPIRAKRHPPNRGVVSDLGVFLAAGYLADPRCPIAASGGQQQSIRTERHVGCSLAVSDLGTFLAAGYLPDPRCPVAAGGGQQPPIRTERHVGYRPAVPHQLDRLQLRSNLRRTRGDRGVLSNGIPILSRPTAVCTRVCNVQTRVQKRLR